MGIDNWIQEWKKESTAKKVYEGFNRYTMTAAMRYIVTLSWKFHQFLRRGNKFRQLNEIKIKKMMKLKNVDLLMLIKIF